MKDVNNQKPNSITGVFLDADLERLIQIDLPIVEHREQIYYKTGLKTKNLSSIKLRYGEFEFMSDFHYGNEAFSETVLHGYLNYLKDHPNILIGLIGDLFEYGEGSRYIADDERMTIDDQITAFIADFKPLAHRIKFMLWGNHEERIIRNSKSKRLMESVARELGLEPGVDVYVGKPQRGVFVVFKAGDKLYGAQIRHSKTQARVNRDLQLKRAGSQNVASLIVHGHTHRLGWTPRTFRSLEVINGFIQNVVRRQYLLASGCFLKYPGYAEAGDYPYTDVGAPIVRFHAQEHNLQYYDLTGFYKNYLTRGGGLWPHAQVELSQSYIRTVVVKNGKAQCPRCSGFNTIKKGGLRRLCNDCGQWFSI